MEAQLVYDIVYGMTWKDLNGIGIENDSNKVFSRF